MGVILFIILAVIAQQVIQFWMLGGRISKFNEELYSDLDINKLHLYNSSDDSIISLPYGLGNGDKIVKVPLNYYGRYRISGDVGLVKRKSNLEKEIEGHFSAIVERDNQNRIKNSKQYKKDAEAYKKEQATEKEWSPKDEEPVVPTTIRILLEEIRSGKTVHMDGREYKLVEHAPDSIENQLDNMLKDSMKEDESILKPFKED